MRLGGKVVSLSAMSVTRGGVSSKKAKTGKPAATFTTMRRAWDTKCCKERVANKETPSCRDCTLSDSTPLFSSSTPNSCRGKACTRSWTMCMYITSPPERTLPALRAALAFLSRLANVQVHLGKTRAWNAAGEEPPGLIAALPPTEGDPPCWTGSWTLQQGLLVLGCPIGSREFVATVLAAKREKHEELLARLPALQDLQSAWLLLLLCAAPRCNYLLRTVPPSLTGLTLSRYFASGRRRATCPPSPKRTPGPAAPAHGGPGLDFREGASSCCLLGILG